MSALDALVVILLIALPWCWLVRRELDKLTDPAYLRMHGVVVVSETVLQAHSDPIGQYLGHPIWGSVQFMGMEYRFDHVQDARKRERLAPGELFLEPSLVYVTS